MIGAGRVAEGPRAGERRLPERSRPWGWTVAVVAAALALPAVVPSERWVRVLILVVIYAVLASGLNLLVGFTGLLDLGYVAFFAVGAYTTALLTVRVALERVGPEAYAARLWWLPFLSIALGALLAGIVAGALGYPTLRARGDYLAIMTLGLGEIVRLVAVNWTSLTRGPAGIPGVPPFALGPIELYEPRRVYLVALAVAVVLFVAIARITRSFVGRAWQAIREDGLVAESMGIRTVRYKLLAYVVGGAVAGAIGVVFAHAQGFINPDSFVLNENFVILGLVILGGGGTLAGPIVGAIAWIVFDQAVATSAFVQDHPEMRQLLLGVLVLGLLRFAPGGVVRRMTRRPPSVEVGSAEEAAGPAADNTADVPPRSPGSAGRARSGARAHRPAIALWVGRDGGQVLHAHGITCRFGGLTALRDVDLELRRGEIVGLIGPNGAGKTTLINVLTGILRPTAGEVSIDGRPVALSRPSDAAAHGIARTFQTIRLLGEMTVLENVLVGAHRHLPRDVRAALGLSRRGRQADREARERAASLLEAVGLLDLAERPASTLSYGHQRRLEIARALMVGPRFLCVDEPAAGMNPVETADLRELLLELVGGGIGVLLVEHDVGLVTGTSDRVLVLDHGEPIAHGRPSEISRHPAVIEAYLGRGVDGR